MSMLNLALAAVLLPLATYAAHKVFEARAEAVARARRHAARQAGIRAAYDTWKAAADAEIDLLMADAVPFCGACKVTDHGVEHCGTHDLRFRAEVEALYREGSTS